MNKSNKIIGIDLGTTNSVVAVMEGGAPVVIPNKEGGRTTPSVVAFQQNGERLVGSPAKRQAVTNPSNTVFSIKRFMGRRHNEVAHEEKMVPYRVIGGPEDPVKVAIGDQEFSPPEIAAMTLAYLKESAEQYLGESVESAVITVPAYFNDAQRQATKDAGQIAGLKVERIINEPTAASLAYGMEKTSNEKLVVFDLGGGTFDVSILEVGDGVFEVKATNGDTHLGGDDFDDALIRHVADGFQQEHGIDLRNDEMALQRLKEACEKAKCELSTASETQINLPFITADQSGPKHLLSSLTRAKFESLIGDHLDRLRRPCLAALSDAGMKAGEVAEVIMVGGSTRVPAVQAMVQEIFGREPNYSVNPDEVVALGAAIQGGVLAGEVDSMVLLDVTPLSLGIETMGSVMTVLVPRNTTIPTTKKEVFTTAADNQPSVEVHVLQGERQMATDNRSIGRFHLDGIAPAPRGVPQVEVEFDIDTDGILHVQATDKATGKEQKIRIESSSGLDESEVERMQADAEAHKEEDEKRRQGIDLRNQADQSVYQARKFLKENEEKVEASDKEAVESECAKLEELLKSEETDALQPAMEAVQAALSKIGEKLYAQQAPEGGAADTGQSPPNEENGDEVVDADFEVKS